jgi:hypothetical protein
VRNNFHRHDEEQQELMFEEDLISENFIELLALTFKLRKLKI